MNRTDFEAAYIERYSHRPRGWNDDFQVYQDAHANGAWFGWQAREVVMPNAVSVSADWLKHIHRDLDACQKLIWANLRGCDPAYCADAQERLAEIDAMLARLNKGAGSHE